MKKQFLIIIILLLNNHLLKAQNDYPQPEFSNEVYCYRKDSTIKLLRLEKGSSKMDTKMKMGGFGGAESGYVLEGENSPVRLAARNLSFVFYREGGENKSAYMDSMMKANGMDPSAMKSMGGGGGDPSNSITLYKTSTEKGFRKIFLQKSGGMFGSKKNQSSDKYTFSIKKIKEGYWELVIDKALPRGEYAFTMMGMPGMGNMDGSTSMFAFGVE